MSDRQQGNSTVYEGEPADPLVSAVPAESTGVGKTGARKTGAEETAGDKAPIGETPARNVHVDKAIWAPVDPVRTGLSGRCPRCGEGRLFDGFLALRQGCSNCRLDYSFADSGDGPAVFVILLIGFITVGLALWMEVNHAPPLWLHFLLWVPLTLVLSLVALRSLKGLLIVLQYRNSAASGELDTGPDRRGGRQ